MAYLLENGIKPDYELIEEKLKPLSTSLEESSFEARLLLHEERRNRDLTQVVSNPPTFEETRNGTIGAPFRKDKT